MILNKIYFTLITLVWFTTASSAQNVGNALLFSQQNYGSTARSKAMGNAFGALGGDFGSLSINPAGIGIYQYGEISASTNLLNLNSTESSYQGNSFTQDNNKFNLKNLGFVQVMPSKKEFSGIVSLNYGIGFNRLANFNQNSFVSTESSPYSRMDAFAQKTNGINYNRLMPAEEYSPYAGGIPWESILAWDNYLTDVTNPDTGGDQYTTFLLQNEKVKQRETDHNDGYLNEYIATIGINYNHRLYLGATFGLQNLHYDETKMYSEVGIDEVGSNLKSWGQFDYSSHSRTSGIGFNLKIGLIYRPIPVLRIGIAVHTPTWFKIKNSYSAWMKSTLTGVSDVADGLHSEETPTNNDKYSFHTPLRAVCSIGYQFAKRGMLSLDYEFVEYSSSKFSKGLSGDEYNLENGDIKSAYRAVSNIRIGGEYKATNAISLRAGVELLGNPYKPNQSGSFRLNQDYNFKTYNGGIGYRAGKYSFDLTYGLGDKTSSGYLYTIDGVVVDPVRYHTFTHEVLFTFCMRI